VGLGSFAGVLVCELFVPVREMRVVCRRLCVPCFVMLCGLSMVSRCVLVVLCGLRVMLCGLLGHKSPFPALPNFPTKTLRNAFRPR
jgi:hypothetical protein